MPAPFILRSEHGAVLSLLPDLGLPILRVETRDFCLALQGVWPLQVRGGHLVGHGAGEGRQHAWAPPPPPRQMST